MEQSRSSISDLTFPITRSELVRRIGSPRQRRRFRRARVVTAVLTALVLISTALGVVVGWPRLVCGTGLQQIRGECVGVNDGAHSFESGIGGITDRIHSMNTEVEEIAASEGNAQAFRIVIMGSFSQIENADLSDDQITSAVGGAYSALMQLNGFTETESGVERASGGRAVFQLYLANEGSVQQGTGAVVNNLESMVHDDIPLSLVIGQSSTTTQTEEAARELSDIGIPMIASSSTSTTINHENSPGLIRAAPNNEDFAAAIRDHLDRNAESDEEPVRGRLLTDSNEGDTFSRDLAEQFSRYLDPYLSPGELSYRGYAGEEGEQFDFGHLAAEICRDGDTNAVFFAGRHSDLEDFLAAAHDYRCGDGDSPPLTVYAMELGLLPGLEETYSTKQCDPTDDPASEHYRLVQASAFDPAWLDEDADSPVGFRGYTSAMEETLGTSPSEDFHDDYSLIYYDAATIAVRATLLGDSPDDEDTLASEVREHLFRVTESPTGSGELEYLEELDGRVTGRYVPILSSDCSAETTDAEPFQTPNVSYEELYPDLAD